MILGTVVLTQKGAQSACGDEPSKRGCDMVRRGVPFKGPVSDVVSETRSRFETILVFLMSSSKFY